MLEPVVLGPPDSSVHGPSPAWLGELPAVERTPLFPTHAKRPLTRAAVVKFTWKLDIGDRNWNGGGAWFNRRNRIYVNSEVVISGALTGEVVRAFVADRRSVARQLRSEWALVPLLGYLRWAPHRCWCWRARRRLRRRCCSNSVGSCRWRGAWRPLADGSGPMSIDLRAAAADYPAGRRARGYRLTDHDWLIRSFLDDLGRRRVTAPSWSGLSAWLLDGAPVGVVGRA